SGKAHAGGTWMAGSSPAMTDGRVLPPRSDRVELPGDVVGDAPQPADIGLADQRVGMPLMPPVEQVDILAAAVGGLDVGLLRGADDERQGPDRLVVGNVDQL